MLRDKVIKDNRKRYEFLIRVTVKDDEEVTAFVPGRIMRRHVDPNSPFLLEMFTLELVGYDFALRDAGYAVYPRLRGSTWQLQD